MGTRLSDSEQYRLLWGTAELESVFEERVRLQRWLDILSALATAQARLSLIPSEAATSIAQHARADLLDLDSMTRAGHTVLDAWGRVDVLVHNGRYVGPGHMDRFRDTPINTGRAKSTKTR